MAAILISLSQQFSTMYFVGRGEMPASEVPLGWAFIGSLTVLVILLTFRPYIELRPDGRLILQGRFPPHQHRVPGHVVMARAALV
ncbi:hypothetical protein [Arthrobacter ginkgonis]